jgi:nucleotide-binding universal stress UspA family protein
MLKRLLVPLDPSSFSLAATSYACELAADHDAEVTGLAMIDVPGIHDSVRPFSPGSAPMAERAELRVEAEAHEVLRGLIQTFEETCSSVGVAHRSLERQGDPVEIIGHESGYYDLLVIGLRTHFSFQTMSDPGKTLSKLLGNLATPIFAVPEVYKPIGSTLDTVIAFDGSPASVRSMRQFAQNFASKNLDVVLLTSTDDLDDARSVAGPAEEYLRAYGFDPVRTEWTPDDIEDVIDERYINEAEIIVAGMHSKRGLFSFHVGSLTDHLVQEAKIPVYIGQ